MHSLCPDSHLLGLSGEIIIALSPWRKRTLKKRSQQAPYFTALLSVYMMLFSCISAWFKMPFFLICVSLLSFKNKMLFVSLIHIISLRLSVLDLEILIYIYLNLGLKYSILYMLLSFNCRECWTIFSSYKIRFLFLKCDQLFNTILCGCGFAWNMAQQVVTCNLHFEECVLCFWSTCWQ